MSEPYKHQQKRCPLPRQRTHVQWPPSIGSHYPRTSFSPLEVPEAWNLQPSSITEYFKSYPQVLNEIIVNLSETKIQYLLHLQETRSDTPESECKGQIRVTTAQKRYELSSIKVQSQAYIKRGKEPDLTKLLFETAETLTLALRGDWFSLYLPSDNDAFLSEYETGGRWRQYGVIGRGTTVSATAAFLGETLAVENLPKDRRFPRGVGHPERNVHSVLSVPLVSSSDDIFCVIEVCRDNQKKPFGKYDQVVANWMLGWMVLSLQQTNVDRILDLQSQLNDFLLNVLHTNVDIDELVEKILYFSKQLVHADRYAMFLVNEENGTLYADYFYDGLSKKKKHVFLTEKQMKFSPGKGIGGYVFRTGQSLNICDAYKDERFDQEVDQISGYRTKSLLCMPIATKSEMVGVIEMVNRIARDHFTLADEHFFKTYAVYCALALHNARMQNKLLHCQHMTQQKYEMLQYLIVAPEEESYILKENTPTEIIPDSFFTYSFNPYSHEEDLPQLFIFMIQDQFGKEAFDFNKLSRFVMTVRKNYRPLAYHNWVHGFQVAHTLYCMIRTNPDVFPTTEAMAMIIAGVCHDLDHRGYNNVFYQKLNLPLADLYGTSVMEEHHYKHAVTIMQLRDHDIFCFLSPAQYKEMLDMIHDAIVATDVSRFFNNKNEIVQMIESKTFDMKILHCRKRIKSLMLTAADLASVSKPWCTQLDMVTRLYREFYTQGDIEKTHGFQPNETMDRELKNKIPQQQVNFIRYICQPLYSILKRVLPGTKPLLKGTIVNLNMWQKVGTQETEDLIKRKLEATTQSD